MIKALLWPAIVSFGTRLEVVPDIAVCRLLVAWLRINVKS